LRGFFMISASWSPPERNVTDLEQGGQLWGTP